MIEKTCEYCGGKFSVIPARKNTARFCSVSCKGKNQGREFVGEDHPRWQGGPREKVCEHCGSKFSPKKTEAISTFRAKKFCSKVCADKGGFRHTGESHHRWSGGKNNRPAKHYSWASKVIARDGGKCQRCGDSGIEVHAHHILGYKENETERFDIENGITLCAKCHWKEHSYQDHDVSSGDVVEGITESGKPFRRVVKPCDTCGKPVSRTLGEMRKNKTGLVFCSHSCSGKQRFKKFLSPNQN